MSWWNRKGTLVRQTPDWEVNNLAVFTKDETDPGAVAFTLWNNSQPGYNFYVYTLVLTGASGSGQPLQGFVAQKQPPIGQISVAPDAVMSFGGQPPGACYTNWLPDDVDTTDPMMNFAFSTTGIQPMVLSPGHPIVVISPNSGFVIYDAANIGFSVTGWYVWL